MHMMRIAGLVIFVLAILGAVWGYREAFPGDFNLGGFLIAFYDDLSTELAGMALTILVLDYLQERREERRLRWQLVREMGSHNNYIADKAVYELRARGWLMDGTLQNADLHRADLSAANLANADLCHANLHHAKLIEAELQNANLSETDLRGADLTGANLQDANLRDSNVTAEQLAQAHSLAGATLPDGTQQGAG